MFYLKINIGSVYYVKVLKVCVVHSEFYLKEAVVHYKMNDGFNVLYSFKSLIQHSPENQVNQCG